MRSISFSKLAIGQQFEFQGSLYLKISPIIARGVDDDAQRLIPRSAQVVPHNAVPATPAQSPAEPPSFNTLEKALGAYQENCLRIIRERLEDNDPQLAAETAEALEQAYRELREALKLRADEAHH